MLCRLLIRGGRFVCGGPFVWVVAVGGVAVGDPVGMRRSAVRGRGPICHNLRMVWGRVVIGVAVLVRAVERLFIAVVIYVAGFLAGVVFFFHCGPLILRAVRVVVVFGVVFFRCGWGVGPALVFVLLPLGCLSVAISVRC